MVTDTDLPIPIMKMKYARRLKYFAEHRFISMHRIYNKVCNFQKQCFYSFNLSDFNRSGTLIIV